MQIQNEVFSESLHFELTVRLRGSAVEIAGTGPSELTKTFAVLFASCVERPTYFITGTLESQTRIIDARWW